MSYREQLSLIRSGLAPKTTGAKKAKPIAKFSDKKLAEIKAEKELRGDADTAMDKWYQARRKECIGVCQCGCGRKSSKDEDDLFRSSCCHIFPKKTFKSIAIHPLNFVERNFWDGCHSNMDNRGLNLWPNMADFDDIKEKFHILAPLLTDAERATKFYAILEKLVYE